MRPPGVRAPGAPVPLAVTSAPNVPYLGSGSRVQTPVRPAAAPCTSARFCVAAPPPALSQPCRAGAAPPVVYVQPPLSASSSCASLRSQSHSQEPRLRAKAPPHPLTSFGSSLALSEPEDPARQVSWSREGQSQPPPGSSLGPDVKMAEYPQLLHTSASRPSEAQAKRACGFAERNAWDGRPASPTTPGSDSQKRAESAGAIARILLSGGVREPNGVSGPAASTSTATTVARMLSADRDTMSPRLGALHSPRQSSPRVTGDRGIRNFVPAGLRGNSPGRCIGDERTSDQRRSPRSLSGSPRTRVRSPREGAGVRMSSNGSVRPHGNNVQHIDSAQSPRPNASCSSSRRELRADARGKDWSSRLPADSSEPLNDCSVLNWYQVSVWEQASVEELVSEQKAQMEALQALNGQNPLDLDVREEEGFLQRAIEDNRVRTAHFMETGEGQSLLAERAREHMAQNQGMAQATAVKFAHDDILRASETKARAHFSEASRQREVRERKHSQRLTIARLQVLRELIRLQARYEELVKDHGVSRAALRGFDAGYVDRIKQESWYCEARQVAERQVLAKAEAAAETLADRSRSKTMSSPRSARKV